ncbi:MAG: O-acetylhomoserine aminocarboxypropyltransferase/cysteine synthase, partial [Oscillospiraceae bacterium]|nr:O-acetylhomoserine aminocarboxypropyltransferase/cysteine synthase [Oscillospiraceae bacterium]
MNLDTLCMHAGYTPENGDTHILPIYQSTTYEYNSTDHIGKLFDLSVDGHMYSRISNPTVACVEEKIAALEGGVGALCTVSGQSATFVALCNILSAGDHFIACAQIYGGTTNLLSVTMRRFGIDVTFVDCMASEEELNAAFRPNTKAVFGETISNPSIDLLDIEKFARVAHAHGVPLIVDNTFA